MQPHPQAQFEKATRSPVTVWGWASVPVLSLAVAATPLWVDDAWASGLSLAGEHSAALQSVEREPLAALIRGFF
jgi:hypothetical protein